MIAFQFSLFSLLVWYFHCFLVQLFMFLDLISLFNFVPFRVQFVLFSSLCVLPSVPCVQSVMSVYRCQVCVVVCLSVEASYFILRAAHLMCIMFSFASLASVRFSSAVCFSLRVSTPPSSPCVFKPSVYLCSLLCPPSSPRQSLNGEFSFESC